MQATNFHFLNTLFETLLKDDGKTGLLQITARQSSFTQQRTAIPNLK